MIIANDWSNQIIRVTAVRFGATGLHGRLSHFPFEPTFQGAVRTGSGRGKIRKGKRKRKDNPAFAQQPDCAERPVREQCLTPGRAGLRADAQEKAKKRAENKGKGR